MNFFVSPDGCDSHAGTKERPFTTIMRARDAIRQLPECERRQDINVYLRGGLHAIDRTIVFGLEDGAPDGASVTYRACENETPVLSGGVNITGWQRLTGGPEGLSEEALGQVWSQTFLKGLNVSTACSTEIDDSLAHEARHSGFRPRTTSEQIARMS